MWGYISYVLEMMPELVGGGVDIYVHGTPAWTNAAMNVCLVYLVFCLVNFVIILVLLCWRWFFFVDGGKGV